MSKRWDIHGGIHPPENKEQSLGDKIASAGIPPQLIVPVSQHIGAAAKPIVEVGHTVLKGQCIARATGAISAFIHAPSSGVVTAIEDRPIAHPSGLTSLCIIIDTDGKNQWRDQQPHNNWPSLKPKELIDIIRHAGIAGMGGAGFPASVKLNIPEQVNIKTLIINGTECEPFITADHALMREQADKLAEGIAILCKLVEPKEVLVGIEDNKMDVVENINTAISKQNIRNSQGKTVSVEVRTFPTKYPSGGEKQLIQILTGQQLPSGKLPSDIGVVCQNMGTVVAIRNAVVNDEPLISRITTLTGNAIANPKNIKVLLGTPINFLLEQANYNPLESNRIIMGGPMMGITLTDISVPIVKTTNCILATTEQELPTPPPAQACIRCGLCAEACPASLLPQQLYWFAQGKELDKLEEHNIADCIECGACSYVCPSHIPLVQYYRASKADIKQRKTDLQNAEHSKLRFEAREQRLLQIEADKIAARKARQARAATNKKNQPNIDPKAAVVAAALERVNAKKSNPEKPVADSPTTKETDNKNDPIARALAKRASQSNQTDISPKEKLTRAVETAENRLNKANLKLQKAQSDNSEHIAAFKQAAETSTRKLNEANAALNAFRNEN